MEKETALPPETIYLQWFGDSDDVDEPIPKDGESQVTWCRDKIFAQDIEFVRADAMRELLEGHRCQRENSMNTEPTPTLAAVDQPRLVRLDYAGKPWTAERLKTSSYIHLKNTENPNDGMMWAVPDENMGNLARRIYHANYTPTREELFGMLSVIDSYRSLLAKPAKRQRTLARVLLQFILPNDTAHTQKGRERGPDNTQD